MLTIVDVSGNRRKSGYDIGRSTKYDAMWWVLTDEMDEQQQKGDRDSAHR